MKFPSQACFDYDLHISTWPGTNDRVMVCFHGYGDDYLLAYTLKQLNSIDATLVSFNFPEYGIKEAKEYDRNHASFGTIDELLPAFYVLKQVVIDQGIDSVDLYGFSSGGGAVVNVIGVLNSSKYDAQLKEIGIDALVKQKLLTAIQKGIVILDTPLKSLEEIIDFRGSTEEFEALAKNYLNNDLRPIDTLLLFQGLSLDILLHFQTQDEILSNRDDTLFIERLKASQPQSDVIIGDDGGHRAPHHSLWEYYSQKVRKKL